MLDLGRVAPGMRVLDLATGRGEPAIAAAHRVGAAGLVLGVDLSESEAESLRQDGLLRLFSVTRILVAIANHRT
jgi:cyclopropane fatty-acyl-phospholipid synthase-like methyltransferase